LFGRSVQRAQSRGKFSIVSARSSCLCIGIVRSLGTRSELRRTAALASGLPLVVTERNQFPSTRPAAVCSYVVALVTYALAAIAMEPSTPSND